MFKEKLKKYFNHSFLKSLSNTDVICNWFASKLKLIVSVYKSMCFKIYRNCRRTNQQTPKPFLTYIENMWHFYLCKGLQRIFCIFHFVISSFICFAERNLAFDDTGSFKDFILECLQAKYILPSPFIFCQHTYTYTRTFPFPTVVRPHFEQYIFSFLLLTLFTLCVFNSYVVFEFLTMLFYCLYTGWYLLEIRAEGIFLS